MKQNHINLKKISIISTLIIVILTSLFGFNAFLSQNGISAEKLNLNDLVLPFELQSNLRQSNQILKTDNEIFDDDLNQYLKNFGFEQNVQEKVKILILFDESIDKTDRINIISSILNDYEVINNYEIIPGTALKCNPNELILKADQLKELSLIKKIYKSRLYTYPVYSNEIPQSSQLSSEDYPNWWIPAIGAEDLNYDGSGVRVAVVDTGIYEHPDLNVILSQNFIFEDNDPSYVDDITGHGTHCAGIIGGDGSSSNGKYRGIAPGVSLINAKAGGISGLEDLDIINAIQWSVLPGGADADIISMSFGGGYPDPDEPLTMAITSAARDYGVILVASAGNSGPSYLTGVSPASGSYVVSVGATDNNNKLASFSSWGPTYSYLGYPDVVAPGVDIISTESPDSVISDEQRFRGDFFDYTGDADYIPLSGTSMACPMVVGALAILKDAYPSISPETARIALLEGATQLRDYDAIQQGAGLINVSKSLVFLNEIENLHGNVNNVSKLFPEEIPTKPFDLLHFPGDYQVFNLTFLSGIANTYDINMPSNIDGLSVSLEKNNVIFSNSGVEIVTLNLKINSDAEPGIKTFKLNITSGSTLYDEIEISVEVKLPEYKILMESYHGLNDWFPEISFYQMRFYDMMNYLSKLNISVDYTADYWTPYHNKKTDISILTEEKLAQYDLVILQTPVLPYSPLETQFLKGYFDSGGNILFLGTRYQDLCLESLNELFASLELDLQINEENIIYDTWLGIGLQIDTWNVSDLNSPMIFSGVDKFLWGYGNTFTTSGDIEAIASIGNQTVAAAYDGVSEGKGKFVAFGDLYWLTDYFKESDYQQDHTTLIRNLMEYFLYQEDISINLALNSEWTATPQINISAYLKYQTLDIPISSSTLNSNLTVSIENTGYSEMIVMNSPFDGYSFNHTFSLPNTSDIPYIITANLTIGTEVYSKIIKVLYYDINSVPQIVSQPTPSLAFRGDILTLTSQLDKIGYDVDAYMSLYSYGVDYIDEYDVYTFTHSIYNSKKTINRTLNDFENQTLTYSKQFTLSKNDSAGFAVAYIVPKNMSSNYYNPFSQRLKFSILNYDPIINETASTFTIDGSMETTFEVTSSEEYTETYDARQGSIIEFSVDAYDPYEDINMANMRVYVNLFMATISEDNYVIIIYPNTFPVAELSYQSSSDTHKGSFTIPDNMQYSTLEGIKTISTETNFNRVSGEGYIALILITVIDSDGGFEEFAIIFFIKPGVQPFNLILGLIIAAVIIIFSIMLLLLILRRKKRLRKEFATESQQQYYKPYKEQEYQPYKISEYQDTEKPPQEISKLKICPYCGFKLKSFKNFCPNCGKPFKFED